MIILLVIFVFSTFLFLFFIRSILGQKEDLFTLARKQREMIHADYIENTGVDQNKDIDDDVRHMLDLLSTKLDDEIDYNK